MGIKTWLKKILPLPIRWANSQHKQLTSKLNTIEQKIDVHEVETQFTNDTNLTAVKSYFTEIESRLYNIELKMNDNTKIISCLNDMEQNLSEQILLTISSIAEINKKLASIESYLSDTSHLDKQNHQQLIHLDTIKQNIYNDLDNSHQMLDEKLNNINTKIDTILLRLSE